MLSTVVVVAVLMLLMVMAVIALWEADLLLFSRANYMRVQRANIESTFTLHCNYPVQDSVVTLYDSVPGSRMKLRSRPWGLYEVVTVESNDRRAWRSGIVGMRRAMHDDCVLWYRNHHGALTLAGKSKIDGQAYLPAKGVTYGYMQAVFFSGERLSPENIRTSGETMLSGIAGDMIVELRELNGGEPMPDSLAVPFRGGGRVVVAQGEINYLSGAVVVRGKRVKIGASARLHDIIIVADDIEIEDGFHGSAQLFARDSVVVGRDVVLERPSGIYAEGYAGLGDGSELYGYMIVDYRGEEDVLKPVCRLSATSELRGLVYCSGVAELQGAVSGCAVVHKSVYYTSGGYYTDFLYDLTLEKDGEAVYPLWLDAPPERRVAKWVH